MSGRNLIEAQWRRVAVGCVVGSLAGLGAHLLAQSARLALFFHQKWAYLAINGRFNAVRTYELELVVLLVALLAIAVHPTLSWLGRYFRGWWAGLTSITALFAACATFASITFGPSRLEVTTVVGLVCLVAVVTLEYWRQRRGVLIPGTTPKLSIPTARSSGAADQRWRAPTSDDPIGDWNEDLVGRAAVVELLADHALRLRTPVIALHGGLGDGKTSVLNLLRRAIEGQAVVVSFSAWLPGSEATLATDLFRDIATECGKHIYIPKLPKRALAYARMLSGSASPWLGNKELLAANPQREEVAELRKALGRVPMPILVLLDEIDRMQKEELLVLLKILRGASSIPNVTFVCAFSEEDIQRELSKDGGMSYEFLEKFFPVSVSLSPPDPDMLGACFQARLTRSFDEQKWFKGAPDATKFADLLELAWHESLSKVCTNFRKAGILVNEILTAAGPIIGEVNPLDLALIEALRRYYPSIYRLVRTKRLLLTYGGVSLTKGEYLSQEHKKRHRDAFLQKLNAEIARCPEPSVAETLLSWLFPDYMASDGKSRFFYTSVRPTTEAIAEDEKRICNSEYFPIYFRGSIPEEMFSNAELEGALRDLNAASNGTEVKAVFSRVLDSIPPKHPKREDFLWKLSRMTDRLNNVAAEHLAYAAAERAADYAFDIISVGEAAQGLNIVFAAAQKLSATPVAQRILEGCVARASDDTFAVRLLTYTENANRNKILTDSYNVNVSAVREAFMRRMRDRYGPDKDIGKVDIAQGDSSAFQRWAENSEQDRQMAQDFWRRFIGQSRKRLAQTINFVFPSNGTWERGDPTLVVDSLLPLREFKRLIENLPADEPLDVNETKGIGRMLELVEGKYHR